MKPAGEPRTLWFIVDGDSAERAFKATIFVGHDIDDLKNAIHEERKDIPASQMVLLKLNDPIPLGLLPARLPFQKVGDFSTKLGEPWRKVLEFFPEPPIENHLHIIIQKHYHYTKDKPRVITPSQAEFDIDAINAKIENELEVLHDVVEAFLKNPEPPTWIPPDNAFNYEFLKNLRLPSYANGKPSLLFHNLDVCDDEEIKMMFGPPAPHMFICNTSGSGKTRRMLEGLTKYWGLYMVASPDINGVGVRDVKDALIQIGQYQEWESDLRRVAPEDRAAQNELNRRIASKELRKVLAARIVVFELFLRLAIKVDGELQEKHKRIWLLFQLGLDTQTTHPFLRIIQRCLERVSSSALEILIRRLDDIRDAYLPKSTFIFGLDEAQQAANLYPHSCISSNSNTVFRSIMRTIAEVFTTSPIRLVVSGTRLSLVELQETMASGVSKPAYNILVYHNLGMFDTWQKLRPFLNRYIPTSILESPSGLRLQKRIREYLLGRYRFSVSFLELFLMNGLQSPHRLLNEFIKGHTTCLPGDTGEPFTSDEPNIQIDIDVKNFEWKKLNNDEIACTEAAQVIQSHLTRGATPIFGPVTDKLVEYGIARLRHGHKGHIVEPLAFLSVMMWLEGQMVNVKSNIRGRLAGLESRGKAFEEQVVLYLLRILRDPIPLHTVFDFYGTPPDWANELAQVVGRVDGSNLPVDVLGRASENPDLDMVQYADSIEDVIHWLQSSDAPAALITSDLFGPDLMMMCKLSSGKIVCLMAQQKSYTTGNKDSLDAKTMAKALTSLHEDHWFKTGPLDMRRKLIDAMEQSLVLRFVAGYPLPPDLNSEAKSVVRARDSLGPNHLATLTLDTFRANFISEDESKNVLRPLEEALARKQNFSAHKTNPPTRKRNPSTRKRKASEIS